MTVTDHTDHASAAEGTHHEIEPGHPPTSTGLSHEKVAMWAFLGSECLLFGGLISTYMLYKGQSEPGSITPADIFDIPYTSVSSFVLLMSSLTMVLALSSIQRGDHRRTRVWLLTTALLGASFVAGQAYEFTVFVREGLNLRTNLFGSSFYIMTGFHGVHVTVGVLMLLSLFSLSAKGRLPSAKAEVVELVGLYWHFVDIVWIVIFTLVYLVP
jgi:cytochrome c oxidase subunit 3/cytochrome o ubiquinol oxidase subunit 3